MPSSTRGEVLTEAAILLPSGEEVKLPVERVEKTELGYKAMARKYSGDDPDVTHSPRSAPRSSSPQSMRASASSRVRASASSRSRGWDWRSEALRSIRLRVR